MRWGSDWDWEEEESLIDDIDDSDAGTTPYPCAYCDKSFGRSDVRAKHISTMHGGEIEIQSVGSETPPS
jgi:hypothetical protein